MFMHLFLLFFLGVLGVVDPFMLGIIDPFLLGVADPFCSGSQTHSARPDKRGSVLLAFLGVLVFLKLLVFLDKLERLDML